MKGAEEEGRQLPLGAAGGRQILSNPVLPGLEEIQIVAFEPAILQDGILRAGHFCWKFIGSGDFEADFGSREREYFTGELVPGAASLRRSVIEPVTFSSTERYHLSSNLGGRCRSDELAIDDPDFAPLLSQLEHELNEVETALGSTRASSVDGGGTENKVLVYRGSNKILA